MRRIHPVASLLVSLGMCLAAAPAFAGDTFFVNSVDGNDGNNCRSANAACLTIAHATDLLTAQSKPQNSVLKLSGTFAETISLSSSSVDTDQLLDGLRITATDTDQKPTIDGTGQDYAVSLVDIHNATVDHLIVTGAAHGINVSGSGSNYISDASIHHNTVTGLVGNPSFTAITLSNAKQSSVAHNQIENQAQVTTDETDYVLSRSIYLYRVRNSVVKSNRIVDVGITNTLTAAASHSTYLYGIYVSQSVDMIVKSNVVRRLTNLETSTVAGTSQYLYTYGIWTGSSADVIANHNTVDTVTSTVIGDLAGTSAYSYAYGMTLTDLHAGEGTNLLNHNTITDVTASANTASTYSYGTGISVDYTRTLSMLHNVIKRVAATASGSIANGTYDAISYGINGPNYSSDIIIDDTTIRNLDANVDYSGNDTSGYAVVKGIVSAYSTVQVANNSVRDLAWSINNHAAANANEYAYLYGIDVGNGVQVEILNNTVRDLTASYTTTSAGGYFVPYTFGINSQNVDTALVQGNTVRDTAISVTNSDPTDASVIYSYLYLINLGSISNLTAANNVLQDNTMTINGGNANPVYNYVYGINLSNSEGTINNNRVSGLTASASSVNGTATQYIYSLNASSLGQLVMNNNVIKKLTATVDANNPSQYVYGIYITNAKPVYVNANEFRNIQATAPSNQSVIGMYLNTDVSNGRILNNLMLGKSDYSGSGDYIGLYLPSDSNTDLDVINNTFANWRYPIKLDGGKSVTLKNNIFAAITNTGYAMAIRYDHINQDQFRSDYNLFYNTLGKTRAIYDTDAAAEIHFGDWSNAGGSYGYDLHSLYSKPRLTASGRLKSNSKAHDRGTDNWNYATDSLEYSLISTDLNGTARPGGDGQVDIGADEQE